MRRSMLVARSGGRFGCRYGPCRYGNGLRPSCLSLRGGRRRDKSFLMCRAVLPIYRSSWLRLREGSPWGAGQLRSARQEGG